MLDGSLQRTNRHGWGDVSLTKQEGLAGVLHRSGREERQGKAPVPCPVAKDGRSSLFGTLAGTEAGGVDSWLGNPLFDPTKGRRALSAPQDPKGRKGLAEVFTLASPGRAKLWGARWQICKWPGAKLEGASLRFAGVFFIACVTDGVKCHYLVLATVTGA